MHYAKVQLFQEGKVVIEFSKVEQIVKYDGMVKIYYYEGDNKMVVSTNMPFVYFEGIADED
jgi:hypothetical protein